MMLLAVKRFFAGITWEKGRLSGGRSTIGEDAFVTRFK